MSFNRLVSLPECASLSVLVSHAQSGFALCVPPPVNESMKDLLPYTAAVFLKYVDSWRANTATCQRAALQITVTLGFKMKLVTCRAYESITIQEAAPSLTH